MRRRWVVIIAADGAASFAEFANTFGEAGAHLVIEEEGDSGAPGCEESYGQTRADQVLGGGGPPGGQGASSQEPACRRSG
ncbi:MAG: hypothetical protein ACXW3Z_11945 [Limisphaerales bacterium]